ncbi:MAG: phosphotransferase [Gammaproteobacteria bacterium]|nr:phosphotransferase [Gammaproteobacteria bacterium]
MVSNIESHPKAGGRCVALFPGAFRPPHAAHYTAVVDLVTRPEVDEVVIIITNRHRNIPGTTKVLDTDVAEQIWRIFVQGLANVRIETAPGSGVKHAFSYLDRVEYGDSILFCLGETDFGEGDTRFENLTELAARKGVNASVIVAPTGNLSVRATALRACLVKKDTGKAIFMSAMPAHLSRPQHEEIWQICQSSMKNLGTVTLHKVRVNLKSAGFECVNVDAVKHGKPDEVYRVQLTDSARYFVKYANDTVKAARLTDPLSLKPRQRLSVERRAIKWLRANVQDDTELPNVVYFDKANKILMLSEVCPGCDSLAHHLEQGVFDASVARRATRFMAKCHKAPRRVSPLWGNQASDINHWQSMLTLRLANNDWDKLPEQVQSNLTSLHQASDAARINGFMHLDFCPKNVLVNKEHIGIIDLEFSSSIGDPAYDLGFFLGHYVIAGICASKPVACQEMLREALSTYQKAIMPSWPTISPRVVAFVGATILYCCAEKTGNETATRSLMSTGYKLLSIKPHNIERVDTLLCDAVAGRLNQTV